MKTPRKNLPGESIAIDKSALRPIRDEDGEDETLTWAPSPNKGFV